MLLQGQEYLKVGKKEMEKFKKKGYIETGKGNKMFDQISVTPIQANLILKNLSFLCSNTPTIALPYPTGRSYQSRGRLYKTSIYLFRS